MQIKLIDTVHAIIIYIIIPLHFVLNIGISKSLSYYNEIYYYNMR